MGIKDILAKAKLVQRKARRTIDATGSRVKEHQARAAAGRAEREAREARELDARLERLQAQEKRLRRKDAAQSSIRAKQRQVADLEARVTTKGRVLRQLNVAASKMLKDATKPARKPRKRRRKR